MQRVTFQVGQLGKRWEDIPKRFMKLKDWQQVVTIAYGLATYHDAEIRVELAGNGSGNGHYFAPHNASNYLLEGI